MPDRPTWDNIFSNWATDRGHSVTAATLAMIGTPVYAKARKRFEAGACERVIRQILDQADTATKEHD